MTNKKGSEPVIEKEPEVIPGGGAGGSDRYAPGMSHIDSGKNEEETE